MEPYAQVDPDLALPRLPVAGGASPSKSTGTVAKPATPTVAGSPVPLADPLLRSRLASVARRGLATRSLTQVKAETYRPWQWIVLHHSAMPDGNLAAYDRIHREDRGWDECGYHFVIGNGSLSRDGQIEVGTRWTKQKHGAHCKVPHHEEYNQLGIGICLVGNFENGRPSAAQIASARALVALLRYWFKIPRSHIRGHGQLANYPGHHHTLCPGAHFPYGRIVPR